MLDDPLLLIVDERASGLDLEERLRFCHLLAILSGVRTVLLSTTIMEDIIQTGQRLARLKADQGIFEESLETLTREANREGKLWREHDAERLPYGNRNSCLHAPPVHRVAGPCGWPIARSERLRRWLDCVNSY